MARLEFRPIDREVLKIFREFEDYWNTKEGLVVTPEIGEYLKYSAVVGRRELPFDRETLTFIDASEGGEGGIRHLIAILAGHKVDTVIMRYEGHTQIIFADGRIFSGEDC